MVPFIYLLYFAQCVHLAKGSTLNLDNEYKTLFYCFRTAVHMSFPLPGMVCGQVSD